MDSPLTNLSHSINKLEICLRSLSPKEDCYPTLAAEINRLKLVLDDLIEQENERRHSAWERDLHNY